MSRPFLKIVACLVLVASFALIGKYGLNQTPSYFEMLILYFVLRIYLIEQ